MVLKIFQQRHFVAEIELLFRCGDTGTGGQAMAPGVHPRFFPRGSHAWSNIRRVANTGLNGVLGARRDNAMQRQHLGFARLIKFRRDNHRVKPAGGGETAV